MCNFHDAAVTLAAEIRLLRDLLDCEIIEDKDFQEWMTECTDVFLNEMNGSGECACGG